ncbi:MAG: hypothetical protein G3M70_15900 [Candidatus Nitronauta litoralis]|uniref:Uncharacterized protein n=1 Tax=Candidatus Nitronauta litoralis TaxID=2705533 RepID=A0A7T0BZA7_9BACT|nr:MAG: hypothetical protein G3M70_15900 [Candidatus Nitronauta litoralis]
MLDKSLKLKNYVLIESALNLVLISSVGFMKKKLKGSKWFLLSVAIILCLPFAFDFRPPTPPKVTNIEWNCDQKPCRVGFDLEKMNEKPIDVVVEIRGYNFSSDLAIPRPRILVGKREFIEHLGSEKKSHFSREIKFTRYPDEIKIDIHAK